MTLIRRLSFPAKLLISFGIIILLTTGLGYFLVNRAINRAFEDFAVRSTHRHANEFLQFFADYYRRTGSWDGLAEILRRAGPDRPLPPLLLTDSQGKVIIAPNYGWLGQDVLALGIPPAELNLTTPIEVDGRRVGTLIALRPREFRNPLEEEFIQSARGALWLTGIAAGGIALLLAFFLLHQTTAPLRALDEAAQKISQGELGHRVTVQSDDEFGHVARSFNEMASSLEKTEQVKRNMIADIAHELRTPISIVRAGLEGLMDRVLPATGESFAGLHTKTLLISRLVDDLHQLALADAGQLAIHKTECNLWELLHHIETTIGAQLEDQQIQLISEIPSDLPSVQADVQRMEQVLLNLLSNAMRYTPAGGVIRVKACAIESQQIQVSVCDSGPGIPEDALPHVFDRFYREDKSRARSTGGSGLGLAIAKALVEAHKGRIWAENALGGGACFHFTLPLVIS